MKKLLALALALIMLFALSACGSDNGSDPSGADASRSGGESGSAPLLTGSGDEPWFNDDASGEDLFARHGLTNVIPEGCTFIRRWTEDPITDAFVRTHYTFEVDHDPTKEERAVYYAEIFRQVLAASDNGKVYISEYDMDTYKSYWVDITEYDEEAAPSSFSYYHNDKFWEVSLSAGPFDDYFVFKLEITTSYSAEIPEK